MYETNQNQRYNLLLQSDRECFQDSQRGRYIKMDCLQVGQESQDWIWIWIWYPLNQRTEKEIYQTSSHLHQVNRQRQTGYCQSFQYHPFRGKENQTTTKSGSICYDCAQVFERKEFNYEETKLQEAPFPEWSSCEA